MPKPAGIHFSQISVDFEDRREKPESDVDKGKRRHRGTRRKTLAGILGVYATVCREWFPSVGKRPKGDSDVVDAQCLPASQQIACEQCGLDTVQIY